MKLLTYKFEVLELNQQWKVDKFGLDNINLLAGVSGVGKTRLLNTIINLSWMIQKKRLLSTGKWDFSFKIDNKIYNYQLDIDKDSNTRKPFVKKEILNYNNTKLIDRVKDKFLFKNKELPKLTSEDIGLYLLKNEHDIKKIFEEFSKIYIRRLNPNYFQEPEIALSAIPKDLLTKSKDTFSLSYIQNNFKDVNTQLFFLKEYHTDIFNKIESRFKEIFSFVTSLDIQSTNKIKNINLPKLALDAFIPILLIKEKGVRNEIPVLNLSSGMLKAIIQLVDVYTIPDGSIYLIDELENSMGFQSLDLMMEILLNQSDKIQFIFTTHHPYIFNNVNVKYWKILTRKGGIVTINSGEELNKKFSKSHQEAYTQLINSELFERGIK